jgi:hypothetical protein
MSSPSWRGRIDIRPLCALENRPRRCPSGLAAASITPRRGAVHACTTLGSVGTAITFAIAGHTRASRTRQTVASASAARPKCSTTPSGWHAPGPLQPPALAMPDALRGGTPSTSKRSTTPTRPPSAAARRPSPKSASGAGDERAAGEGRRQRPGTGAPTLGLAAQGGDGVASIR